MASEQNEEDIEVGAIASTSNNVRYEGDDDSPEQGGLIGEYEISASPNDFNVRTLYDFIDSGIVKVPGFQRNYVWDIKRASKLIESLLIGIPVPQIFLYEEAKNSFLVIDGQQRYFTIYFFKKKRFPIKSKRFELRRIFDEAKGIPDHILADSNYFVDFNLKLAEQLPDRKNRFNGLNYSTLRDEDRTALDLRTIRNIIIKQNSPDDGDSVVFEIFNRLNTGGVNLKPQEIRTSLYHSAFYDMLYRVNLDTNWRKLTPDATPDLNMKDVEILLRGFAMLVNSSNYRPSLSKFLNEFSLKAKSFSNELITQLESLFEAFTRSVVELDEKIFFTKSGRFNISVYEAIFVALCEKAFIEKTNVIRNTTIDKIEQLKSDSDFSKASLEGTAGTASVTIRLNKAREIL